MRVIVILLKSSATRFGFIIVSHLAFVILNNCWLPEALLSVMKQSASGAKSMGLFIVTRSKRNEVSLVIHHQCSFIFRIRGINRATKAFITDTNDFPVIIAFRTNLIVYEHIRTTLA